MAIDTVLITDNIIVRAGITIILTVSVIVIGRLAVKHLLWPRVRKTGTELDDRILHLLESFLTITVIIFGLQSIMGLFVEYFGDSPYSINYIFFLLYWTVSIYIIFRLISIISNWYLSKVPLREHGAVDKRLVYSIRNVFMIIVSLFAFLVLIDYFNVTGAILSGMLAALGVGGIIIGLAAQTTLTNIIIGGALLIDRPFRIGDRIRIEQLDTWGDVIEIGWRSTRVLTVDNRLIAIPNSIMGTDLIVNYSIPEKMFRVETDVIVSYGIDIDHVRRIIVDVLRNEQWILHEKPVQVLLLEFTDHGIKFKVRCWIEDYVETRISEDRLNTAIYKELINKKVPMPSSSVVVYFGRPEDKKPSPGRANG